MADMMMVALRIAAAEERANKAEAERDALLEALKKIVECERNRAKDLRHRSAWLPLKFSEERIAAAEAAIAKVGGSNG